MLMPPHTGTPQLAHYYVIFRLSDNGTWRSTGASIDIYCDGTVCYNNGDETYPATRREIADWLQWARLNETVWLKRHNRV